MEASQAEETGSIPVACSLGSADLASQGQAWQRLAARAMAERSETAGGFRVCFRAEPGAEEELRRLVAVERECCAWARWNVTAGPGQVVLDVSADGDGIAALHAMFGDLATGDAPAKGANSP